MSTLGRAAGVGLVIACLVACSGAGEGEADAAAATDAAAEPTAPAELVGNWTLVQLDAADLTTDGETPTMMFGADGTVAGNTGLNRYSTVADMEQLSLGILALGPAVTTRRAGPPGAMEVERKFLEHLANEFLQDTSARVLDLVHAVAKTWHLSLVLDLVLGPDAYAVLGDLSEHC